MAATLNIAALARRTGVPADTIRKWEQRYGVLRPERTAGGQRRYSELDVSRVEWLKARLDEGYRIGEAAAILERGEPTLGTVEQQRGALAEAVGVGDGDRVTRILEEAFRSAKLEDVVELVVEPVLRELGDRWAAGEGIAAHEHLVSQAIRAHVGAYVADARGGTRGTAVLASGPGDFHDLGLLVLALLLHREGWQVSFLGAALPVGDALRFATTTGATLVAISVTLAETYESLKRELAETDVPDELTILIGGQAVNGETPTDTERVRWVSGDARSAVAALAQVDA